VTYNDSSLWNEENEIRSLIIMKRLQDEGFPRGRQMELCREMSRITGLDPANISAKVGNYKSLAGINKSSHASVNSKNVYERYGRLTIDALEAMVR